MSIQDRVIATIDNLLLTSTAEVNLTPETTFVSLNADSLDMMEVVMGVEDEFGIEISDEQAEGLFTIGHVVKLVEELLK
jgi:acyl carrier protein